MIINAKLNVKKNLTIDLKYLNEINLTYFADLTKKFHAKCLNEISKNPQMLVFQKIRDYTYLFAFFFQSFYMYYVSFYTFDSIFLTNSLSAHFTPVLI